MMKTLLALSTIMFFFTAVPDVQAANDVFVCKCIAKGPGVDNRKGQKICSYNCSCNGFNKDQPALNGVKISVESVATTAQSRDTWDSGSSICHGQYAYKSNLNDPNWKIQVRFSPFNISSYNNAGVYYDEADQSVEVAIGVKYYIKRTMSAPEVVDSIRSQF